MSDCFECGQPAEHDHHVVPRALGGTKTVPLCVSCHGKVHGRAMAHTSLTRARLQALKARGVKLGSAREGAPRLDDAAREKGVKAAALSHARRADQAYADLRPMLAEMRAGGLSLRAIAERLNAEGHATRTGKPWNGVQVSRVLGRAAD